MVGEDFALRLRGPGGEKSALASTAPGQSRKAQTRQPGQKTGVLALANSVKAGPVKVEAPKSLGLAGVFPAGSVKGVASFLTIYWSCPSGGAIRGGRSWLCSG